ncbi:hypothetical protein HZS_7443, partial [Henneguya salminicola]
MFTDTFENIFPTIYPVNQRQIYNGIDRSKDDIFVVKLDVAQFKPIELSVKVEGNKLIISGKHQNKNKNGHESCDFVREYDIPCEVDIASITSRITPTGVLIVEGDVKKDDPKCSLNNDAVDISDACKFHVFVNISGYKPDEISVKLSGNDLVVEGKQSTELKSDDGKRKMKRSKGFVYTFALPPDVDINSMIPKFSSPSRLDIEAPRINKRPECNEKSLEIKNGQIKQ